MNPRWVKNAHWIGLLFIVGFMSFYSETDAFSRQSARAQAVLCFGFLLLSGYLCGEVTRRWRLPALTGYLAAGILFGPQLGGLITGSQLIGELALTVGGELHLKTLKSRARGIFLVVGAILLITIPGVTFGLGWICQGPFGDAGMRPGEIWMMAALLGVLSIGPSPATAIALIRETRAKGLFTELMLGVTVCLDVFVVVLFAVAMSLAGSLLNPDLGLNTQFIVGLGIELLVSLILGGLAGFALGKNVDRLRGELAVVILVFCVFISQASYAVSHFVEYSLGMHFKLEPVLICMAAGMVIQNATKSGHRFMEEMERISIPIYIVFFAILGVRINLMALVDTWMIALGFLILRLILLWASGWAGGWAAGEKTVVRKWLGTGMVTQAGVSVGLALLISGRFPEWGDAPVTLALAVIGLNQVVGPILLKIALERSGETVRRTGVGEKLEAIRRLQERSANAPAEP
jgi:Kef-type K+ transport system membrane component KefB